MEEPALRADLDACLLDAGAADTIADWADLDDPFPAWRRANRAA